MVLSFVHNFINFDKMSNTTAWNAAPNREKSPLCSTDVCKHSLLFPSLISSTYLKGFKPNISHVWSHCSTRPVVTEFQSISGVIWHTLGFPHYFPSFKKWFLWLIESLSWYFYIFIYFILHKVQLRFHWLRLYQQHKLQKSSICRSVTISKCACWGISSSLLYVHSHSTSKP